MRIRWPVLLLCLSLACDGRDSATTAPSDAAGIRQVTVFASTFPLADLARQVGGTYVRVDWLIDLGDPLTGFIPTAAERERMIGNDLILLDGPRRTEGWAQQELIRMQAMGKLVAIEDLEVTRTMPTVGLLQLDPVAAKAFIPVIAAKLGEALPKQREYFNSRAAELSRELETILRAHPNSAFGRGRVVVLDDMPAALLDRFSIGHVRVDADVLQLSNRDVDRIRAKAAQEGARTLLVPFDTPPGAVTDIQSRTGLRVVTIDPLGYPNYQGHGTYVEVVKFNLEQLKAATQE